MTTLQRHVALIDQLRSGQVHRAVDLAQQFGVSERTIYRDMRRLTDAGVPVEGSRGTGYRLLQEIALPPLRLRPAELEALNLGLVIVGEAADEALRRAAEALAEKLDAVLPQASIAEGAAWTAALSPYAVPTRNLTHLAVLRQAARARQKLRITYTEADGRVIRPVLHPLEVAQQGRSWVLIAWEPEVADFGRYRLDLMESVDALPDLFVPGPGEDLETFHARSGV